MQSAWFWLLLAGVMLSQSTWLFVNASRRGGLKWFWGLWGLFSFPMPLLVFCIMVWTKNRKEKLGKRN